MTVKCDRCGAYLVNSTDHAMCPNSLKHVSPCLSGLWPRMKVRQVADNEKANWLDAVQKMKPLAAKRVRRKPNSIFALLRDKRCFPVEVCRQLKRSEQPVFQDGEIVLVVGEKFYVTRRIYGLAYTPKAKKSKAKS